MKKIYAFLLMSAFVLALTPGLKAQVFFDDFTGTSLNTSNWNIANTAWGNIAGRRSNGGVVPENVRVTDGNLVVEAHGNYYNGPVQGHGQNIRVGGAISTKREFASGSFEIRAKICPQAGALSAFWTYYNPNDDPNYNHEIDFEFPGRNQEPNSPATSSLEYGLMTSWRGTSTGQYKTHDKYFGNQTDGNYHLYRFEWHTGGNGQTARVEWYYDNVLMATNSDPAFVPNHAGNYWIGIWFPWWIAEPNFNIDHMYVDWIRITPFNEPNDLPAPTCTAAPAQPGLIVGNTTVAAGSSQIYYVDNVPGATSYTWTLPSGWSGASSTNAITATTGTSGGTISVRSNNACGTSTARTLNVTVSSCTGPPQPGLIVGNTSVSSGSSQIYYVDNVPGATSYTWALPSGWSGASSTNAVTATVGSSGGTISVRSNNACGTSTARTLNVTVSGGNLARGKNVVVSSNETSTLVGVNAVDGNMGTRWASQYTNSQWIYVDLGATYNINRVKINWEAAYGRNYQIQVSSNASGWSTIRTVSGNTSLTNDFPVSGTGRYLRINGTLRGTEYGYSIYELEVYGTSSARLGLEENVEAHENREQFVVFPIPFTVETKIQYELEKEERVTVEVFDLKGTKVQSLLKNRVLKAGKYQYYFSAPVPGTYIVKLIIGKKVLTKRLTKY